MYPQTKQPCSLLSEQSFSFQSFQGDHIPNEIPISIFCLSSRNPQKSLMDLMISLAIPVFKKPSFEQEILSVLYIPDVQGRLQIIVKVAEALLEGSGDPTAALCCTECLLSCSIESCCQLGTTGTLSQSSFCRGEVWYDSQDKSRIDVCMPDAHPDAFLLILRQVHFYFVSNSLTHANVSSSARAHSYKICALCPSPQQHSVLKINLPIFSSSPSSPRG